ncbi:helix-turn-helix domain-containing protein [Nesterenkonia sp. HG001]|uniref:TetR/AcrR family transcriptional regulator n=1 Tax=Nesterenkonia sp. HG001 TaxID=2983207 RepID=UPI002AC5A9D1|nr:helix-turn-helix domain-containing protein [Nesterenkonia sp. HG001]MDZ5076683.1 TetR/AcrR family transcriptional regulator [Nesterenkonia sp. HG001]
MSAEEETSMTAREADEDPGLTPSQARILQAFAELVEELGTDDVSFKLIARRAGIGERTVFRHYGTRAELLVSAAAWFQRVAFPRPGCESIFDFPLLVRESMESYARRRELAHVVAEAEIRGADGIDPAPGRAGLERLLSREIPDLAPQERRDLVAGLCHLDSAGTWVSLHRQVGPETRDVADAAAWSAEILLDPLRGRKVPR